jgi:nucleoside-diphosphate-sugar epimerase
VRIAVTGASGFIGGAIATALADREHDVTGFGRTRAGWSHPRGSYSTWDLTSELPPGAHAPPSRRRSGSDDWTPFDAVVHCAALADDWADPALAERVNVGGTRSVIARFPGARFVHLSTSSVYDAFTPSRHARETEHASHFLSAYSATKAAAELEYAGTDAVILRPHAVYGPGDRTLLPRVLAAVRGRTLRLPEGARADHTLTHVDNVVAAVIHSIERSAPAGIYNIGDATDVPLHTVITEFLHRRGMPDVRIASVPYAVAYAAAGALESVHRATGRGRPRITRYAVSQLGLERTLDLTAARTRLGFDPTPTTLAGAERW